MRRISRGDACSRSSPSNIAVPETVAPATSPVRLCVATLLPDPDSPTMPRVWPASTVNDTPRTARTTPSGVLNETWRSFTSRRATWFSFPGSDCRTQSFEALGSAALLRLVQPDVRRVEVLDGGDVHGVVHLARVVVRLLRVGD